MNRSTVPAESTSFCLPVKNGWQREHSCTVITGLVERVLNVFPQLQVTVASVYFG